MEISKKLKLPFIADETTLVKLNESFLCKLFLHSVFLNWPQQGKGWKSLFFRVFYGVFFLFLIGATLYSTIEYAIGSPQSDAFGVNVSVLDGMVSCCFCLELFSFLYALYYGYLRVLRPFNPLEMQYFEKGSVACLLFEVIFLILILISNPWLDSIVAMGNFAFENLITVEWFGSLGVAISLCFIIVDARCSAAMVQDLCTLAENQSLTMAQVTTTRVEIQRRVDESFMVNAVIVLIALFHSATFLVEVLLFVPVFGGDISLLILELVVCISLYLKEAVYLVIALSEIARVNDLADKLLHAVGKSNWSTRIERIEEEQGGERERDKDEDKSLLEISKEQRRLRIFVNLSAEPISFRLLGTRPTRLSVCVQILGYCVSIVIAFLKSNIE